MSVSGAATGFDPDPERSCDAGARAACRRGADPAVTEDRRHRRLRPLHPPLPATNEGWLLRLPAVSFNAQQYPNAGDVTAASPACLTLAPSHTAADADALNLCGSAGFKAGQFERAEQLLAAAARRLPHHAGLSENLELARRRRAAH